MNLRAWWRWHRRRAWLVGYAEGTLPPREREGAAAPLVLQGPRSSAEGAAAPLVLQGPRSSAEGAAAHLARCRHCARELDALAAFQGEVQAWLSRYPTPHPGAAKARVLAAVRAGEVAAPDRHAAPQPWRGNLNWVHWAPALALAMVMLTLSHDWKFPHEGITPDAPADATRIDPKPQNVPPRHPAPPLKEPRIRPRAENLLAVVPLPEPIIAVEPVLLPAGRSTRNPPGTRGTIKGLEPKSGPDDPGRLETFVVPELPSAPSLHGLTEALASSPTVASAGMVMRGGHREGTLFLSVVLTLSSLIEGEHLACSFRREEETLTRGILLDAGGRVREGFRAGHGTLFSVTSWGPVRAFARLSPEAAPTLSVALAVPLTVWASQGGLFPPLFHMQWIHRAERRSEPWRRLQLQRTSWLSLASEAGFERVGGTLYAGGQPYTGVRGTLHGESCIQETYLNGRMTGKLTRLFYDDGSTRSEGLSKIRHGSRGGSSTWRIRTTEFTPDGRRLHEVIHEGFGGTREAWWDASGREVQWMGEEAEERGAPYTGALVGRYYQNGKRAYEAEFKNGRMVRLMRWDAAGREVP